MELVSVHDTGPVIDYLTRTLREHLERGERVLWLVPGGSAITVAADVSNRLHDLDLGNLTVSLTDERYGELNHPDENWPQLVAAGFSLPGAALHRVLEGNDRDTTTEHQAAFLEEALANHDYTIGLFGMGADGHAAGVKPGSTAVDSPEMAASFAGDDFERLTMTPAAISRLDEIVVSAFGEAKFPQIKRLLHEDVSLTEQPAQALKSAHKSTIFTDYQEEDV